MAAYQQPQLICLGKLVAEPIIPRTGIIAGCFAATSWIRVDMLPPLHALVARSPSVDFDLFINDLVMASVGRACEVFNRLVEASQEASKTITEGVGSNISLDKAGAVASDKKLLSRLRAALGLLAGRPVVAAKSLGIDFTSGRKAGISSHRTRALRQANLRVRVKRFIKLVRAAKRKAHKIVTTGLRPSFWFGSEVTGLRDSALVMLQKLSARALPPFSPAASRSSKLAVHGASQAKQGWQLPPGSSRMSG
jgi:hypothetical protein